MTLTPVPKPDGFELREARANRESDGSKWLPADALYDASRQLAISEPSVALLVAWYERLPNGNLKLCYRIHQEHSRQALGLVADMMCDLTKEVP